MKQKYLRITVNLLVFVVTVLLCVFLLPRLILFFMPFVVGWVISLIANPLVKLLEKHVKIKRKAGSVIIIVLVLAIVILLMYLVVAAIVKEVIGIVNSAPDIIESFKSQLDLITSKLGGVYDKLPKDVQGLLTRVEASFTDFVTGIFSNLGKAGTDGATGFAKGFVEGFLMVIITIVSAYFFVADREELAVVIKKITPKAVYEKIIMIRDNFGKAFGGYFKAQFKIMIVITLILFIGLEIMRVDYSFVIALIIAFLDLLPVLGTGTVLGPWTVIEIFNGNYLFAVGLVALYIICQVVKQVLQPKMVGDSIGMNPLLTLFFMFVGYKFGGMAGLIIGIPVGMVLVNFYQAGVFDDVIADFKTVAADINNLRKLPDEVLEIEKEDREERENKNKENKVE